MEKKSKKLDIGTVYQKEPGGLFYFRYQINHRRKMVSLKTRDPKEAEIRAKELIPILQAKNVEIVAAHVKHARDFGRPERNLPLHRIWEAYSSHPDRATPATVSEQESYRSTLSEFISFIGDTEMVVRNITPSLADEFARYLKTTEISVDTHNRKIKRLRRIFSTISDYIEANPFTAKVLFRKEREEQELGVRRLAFTREQEQQLLEVLEDAPHKVINKPELRVVYHLGMYTGQRLKDCVLLQWSGVSLERRRINVKQFKTGKEVTIPIADKLLEVLNEAKEWQTDAYVCPKSAARYNAVDGKGKNTGNNLVMQIPLVALLVYCFFDFPSPDNWLSGSTPPYHGRIALRRDLARCNSAPWATGDLQFGSR